jgi:hypothetical protein
MWSELRERFSRKTQNVPAEDFSCKNCGTTFSGHYCPNCGQAVRDYDQPVSFIFYNFLGDFFAFDTRFFRTLWALVSKPGFLSKEYFDGRRVRYAPPFRIYIFVSFILFLLLQIYTNRGLTIALDSELDSNQFVIDSISVAANSLMSTVNKNIDAEDKAVLDSLVGKFRQSDTASLAELDIPVDMETFRDTRNIRQALNKVALRLEEQLAEESDPQKRVKLREYIGYCRSPESALARILEYISWAFFLLLPIFALLLKLVYIRRRHNYMRHLVFSIHIHSFIFLIMIAIVSLYMSFDFKLGWITTFLILSVPVYLVVAMKKFYGQDLGKVILKFLAVTLIYNIVLFVVVTLASLNAIHLVS